MHWFDFCFCWSVTRMLVESCEFCYTPNLLVLSTMNFALAGLHICIGSFLLLLVSYTNAS